MAIVTAGIPWKTMWLMLAASVNIITNIWLSCLHGDSGDDGNGDCNCSHHWCNLQLLVRLNPLGRPPSKKPKPCTIRQQHGIYLDTDVYLCVCVLQLLLLIFGYVRGA